MANEIRPVMKRLGDLAEKYQCAIVLIIACNTSNLVMMNNANYVRMASGSKSTYRGLGSIDFQATARSVLIVGRVKDNPTLRVIAHDKSSLAPEKQSIAFRLDRDNGFSWEGSCDISVDELLSGDTKGSKIREAKAFLSEFLSDGQKSSSEIEEAAKAKGIKKKTLWNAKQELNIDAVKVGNKWFWML